MFEITGNFITGFVVGFDIMYGEDLPHPDMGWAVAFGLGIARVLIIKWNGDS